MNRNLSLSIPQPCSEKWDNFTPTSNGGFCSSCSKVVVDFSKMTDEEIIKFFSKNQTQTCGRFRSDQLKTYSHQSSLSISPGFTLFKAGALSLLLLLVSKQSYAQGEVTKTQTETVQGQSHSSKSVDEKSLYTIRGVVKDEEGSPIPGASVWLKGTVQGTATDAKGVSNSRKNSILAMCSSSALSAMLLKNMSFLREMIVTLRYQWQWIYN